MSTLFPALKASAPKKSVFPQLPQKEDKAKETKEQSNDTLFPFLNHDDSSKVYNYKDDENHTRTALLDKDNDGKIDSASYFLDDEDGKCLYSQYDFDYDGKYDEMNHYLYWEDGALQAIEVDEDGDGKFDRLDLIGNEGEVTFSTRNYTVEE